MTSLHQSVNAARNKTAAEWAVSLVVFSRLSQRRYKTVEYVRRPTRRRRLNGLVSLHALAAHLAHDGAARRARWVRRSHLTSSEPTHEAEAIIEGIQAIAVTPRASTVKEPGAENTVAAPVELYIGRKRGVIVPAQVG